MDYWTHLLTTITVNFVVIVILGVIILKVSRTAADAAIATALQKIFLIGQTEIQRSVDRLEDAIARIEKTAAELKAKEKSELQDVQARRSTQIP